ncbi:hypothetical protein Lesp02_60590 [Lentzea sp. NBRC 105346]|uniref:MBL fold metallo-hydrolase n=1 Tax=Lentzea sp. NBRC 105346 TaxID=3032205 RepID=UPI002552619E|nr:MBL fold metallo-hydrolase [Lentzea sp. NBRC 105346]GLZ33871.1 hypothetical protein Lesp02_60590 [Lentzea sp. NBRC 105346]
MNLDVKWHAGWPSAKHDPAPPIQVHSYDSRTFILRQNKSVHYEAPFMFLLLGTHTALLIDTGATAEEEYFPLRDTVSTLIGDRRLQVVHTHAHGDHVAGDGQFTDVVAPTLDAVIEFFGFTDWPSNSATVDLGDRIVDAIPGPGHQESAVVFYDRQTGLLLTGDTLYPGRLYIFDWDAYVATIDRLIAFCSVNPVTHVLGCHIEMTTTPGVDYPIRTTYHPSEPPLQLTVDHLRALRAALDETAGAYGPHPYPDFIVQRMH